MIWWTVRQVAIGPGSKNNKRAANILPRATVLNGKEMFVDGGFLFKRNKEKGEWTKKLKACAHSFIILSIVHSIVGIKKLLTPHFG